MSEEIGEFVRDGESGNSSDVDGSNNTQDGISGTSGNVSQPTNIINGYESFAPADPATERIPDRTTANGEPKRTKSGKIDRRTKAGRNAGSQETPDTVSYAPKKLVSLEQAILSLHDMAAGIFGIPELSLSEPEAKALNDAMLDVSKYYVSAFDPKKVAIFNLVTCMGGIYAVRIMAYRNRVHLQRKNKLSVMPNQQTVPPTQSLGKATTIEEYLGGQPPTEGAAGF